MTIKNHPSSHPHPVAELWIPVVLGLLFCFLFTGIGILDPTMDYWQLAGADPAQHNIGWRFFRDTPFLQFPLGANPALGETVSSSIVFSDAIPLLALIFKYLRWALPDGFYYFGLWIALCFVLQGVFAWKILAHFVDNRLARTLAMCFFLIVPSMLNRIAGHEALAGQWIILAGIYLYLEPRLKSGKWILLLCCAVLVHAYLFAMAFSLWLLDWASVRTRATGSTLQALTLRRWLLELPLTAVPVGLVMWSVGYFVSGPAAGLNDYGLYRMNLLGPIDPQQWSRFLPALPSPVPVFEGFNYLGLGLLVLAAIVACEYRILKRRVPINWTIVKPCIYLAIGLTAYAVTNHVTLGRFQILSFPLPHFLDSLTSIFRAGGRFFWVVGALLTLALLYLFLAPGLTRGRMVVLAALLALQVADLSLLVPTFRARFAESWTSPLVSPFWTDVARQYTRIAFVIPTEDPPDYVPLALYAAKNHMSMNTAHLARINRTRLEARQIAETAIVMNGGYDAKTLYVFNDNSLWRKARENARPTDFIGKVDGYRVLAPGWNGCVASCGLSSSAVAAEQRQDPAYYLRGEKINAFQPGQKIDFKKGGNSEAYAFDAWSDPEADGRWTNGVNALVSMKLDDASAHNLLLRFSATAFLTPVTAKQDVDVSANGVMIANLSFTREKANQSMTEAIAIPQSVLAGRKGWLTLEFRIEKPVSPAEAGFKGDPRLLGIMMHSLTIERQD